MSAHRGYVTPKPKLDKATGEHFNRPGHKCADMGVTILEKVHNKDPMYLIVREEFWIRQFITLSVSFSFSLHLILLDGNWFFKN